MNAHTLDRLRNELRGVILTIGLVALLTLGVFAAVQASGLGHGSVVYLLPVLIAAIRWGIVSALVAAVCGVLASAFFFYPPLYSLRITRPARGGQPPSVHLRRRGGEPTGDPAAAAIGAGAAARGRPARPVRLLAPAGGGLRRRRHSRRDRGPPGDRDAAQRRLVRRGARRRASGRRAGASRSRCCDAVAEVAAGAARHADAAVRRRQRRNLAGARGVAEKRRVRRRRHQSRPQVAGRGRRIARAARRRAGGRHRHARAARRRARHQRGAHARADRAVARGADRLGQPRIAHAARLDPRRRHRARAPRRRCRTKRN